MKTLQVPAPGGAEEMRTFGGAHQEITAELAAAPAEPVVAGESFPDVSSVELIGQAPAAAAPSPAARSSGSVVVMAP